MPRRPAPSPPAAAADLRWLSLDRQLCFALYSASLAMTKRYKPLLAPLGLTYPQYLVMLALWERDGLTVSELGQRLTLDSGTLTPLLKRLQAAGWLHRQRDPQDERCVRLQLTPSGWQLRQQAATIPAQVLCASACTLDEITHLTQQLQHLRQSLSDAA